MEHLPETTEINAGHAVVETSSHESPVAHEADGGHELKHEQTLYAEPVFHIGSFPVTNALITSWVAVLVIVILAVALRLSLKKVPGKLQHIFEIFTEGAFSVGDQVTNDLLLCAYQQLARNPSVHGSWNSGTWGYIYPILAFWNSRPQHDDCYRCHLCNRSKYFWSIYDWWMENVQQIHQPKNTWNDFHQDQKGSCGYSCGADNIRGWSH